MAIDLNDEILQDFLVEAGEILELLGEQLVELEQSPDDLELLNAIFRGFHTVKGGAGFLAIHSLVEVCHSAEDVFNLLRQGDMQVTAELMDVILQVVDIVNDMFEQVRAGNEPEAANPVLLEQLNALKTGVSVNDNVVVTDSNQVPVIEEPDAVTDIVEQEFESMLETGDEPQSIGAGDNDEITEEEFEDLLDVLHGKGRSPTPSTKTVADDEITEDEFENLLDELHGKGKFSGNKFQSTVSADTTGDKAEVAYTGDISEDEFEQVLDQLHGKGKFSSANVVNKPLDPAVDTNDERQSSKSPVSVRPQDETGAKLAAKKTEQVTDQAGESNKTATKTTVAQGETTVRVDTHILDEIMNMVGELVLVRNRFQTLKANDETGEHFSKAVSNLDVVTADLQLAVMKTRMQPIKKVFGRFPRVVRDLARNLKKEIRLELVGEETDLDKNLVEALADPLVHLVRNAVDHGVEMPDERVAKGKPREGLIILTASQEGDHIQLSIKDDGKGMNANVLRDKVVEKNLMDAESASRLDDKECYNLIFMPGFSTKTEISDVSGRGVGMDVVKTRITQMNGVVEVDSSEGVGSTIIIKVPLTLAIMPTLMVKLDGQAFALPLASVMEILDLDLAKTNVVDGQLVIMVRQRALPIFYLGDWLIQNPNYVINKRAIGHVVVVNAGGQQVGFVVDQLIGQEEVVIKPLGAKLQSMDGLSGATITGDGRIALILDVPGLMKRYAA
jgi:two-component system, chemotaxis family, sensor kinase CheA